MDCCGAGGTTPSRKVRRRTVLKGATVAASSAFTTGTKARAAKRTTVQLGFCGQILCAPPYEVTRDAGFFGDEGLDLELVYLRGSTEAMQALVVGAVDYAATSFDDVLQAYNRGAEIRRFFSTGRLPLQALAIAPNRVSEVTNIRDLEGRIVGIVSRGSIAEVLTRFLMKREGADAEKVEFAVLGPNISEPIQQGLVDAAWIGEPALSLLVRQGGRALVNLMRTEDAEKYLGGHYEFMGVSVRAAEFDARRDQMRALARALQRGLSRIQTVSPDEITAALPRRLLADADSELLTDVFARYRTSLYPRVGSPDIAACNRVADTLRFTRLIRPEIKAEQVLDYSITGS